MLSYAIGDIHGRRDLLAQAHEAIAADRAREGDREAPVVHCGDYVDRGPECRAVLQVLIDGIAAGEPWVALLGNHDRMFLRFLDDPAWADPHLRPGLDWLAPPLGGVATLMSYGVARAGRSLADLHAEAVAAVPAAHRAFLASLPLMHRRGEAVFVHAGIRPGVALPDQTEQDLVWIREPFLSDPSDHGALVVHGHTVIDTATHYGNRLNIDSGAVFGGTLSAVAVEGRRAWLLTRRGRVALPAL